MIAKDRFIGIVGKHFDRIVGDKMTEGEACNLITSLLSELGLPLLGANLVIYSFHRDYWRWQEDREGFLEVYRK